MEVFGFLSELCGLSPRTQRFKLFTAEIAENTR